MNKIFEGVLGTAILLLILIGVLFMLLMSVDECDMPSKNLSPNTIAKCVDQYNETK